MSSAIDSVLASFYELKEAAANYANRYAIDEAEDEIVDGRGVLTGCTKDQNEDARRLFAALKAAQGGE